MSSVYINYIPCINLTPTLVLKILIKPIAALTNTPAPLRIWPIAPLTNTSAPLRIWTNGSHRQRLTRRMTWGPLEAEPGSNTPQSTARSTSPSPRSRWAGDVTAVPRKGGGGGGGAQWKMQTQQIKLLSQHWIPYILLKIIWKFW